MDRKTLAKARRKLTSLDPKLKPLFKRHKAVHFEPKIQFHPFQVLVQAIANQQLHAKAARTILNRMIDLFPGKTFPSAEDLLATPVAKLRACGFSHSKIKAIKDLAQKTVEGVVPDLKSIRQLGNEEIIERLTQVYGVGRWTVEMLLIFQLGRLDVWPADDFGVRKGFQIWQRKKNFPAAKDLKKWGARWAPYQSVVSLYLWREADLAKAKTV